MITLFSFLFLSDVLKLIMVVIVTSDVCNDMWFAAAIQHKQIGLHV